MNKKKANLIVGASFIGFIILMILIFGGSGDSGTQTQQPPASANLGSSVILDAGDGVDPIFLATDQNSFNELSKAMIANDSVGVLELINGGKVFEISRGSKATLIDSKTGIRRVRITDGVKSADKDKVGLSGWLPMEWVKTQ